MLIDGFSKRLYCKTLASFFYQFCFISSKKKKKPKKKQNKKTTSVWPESCLSHDLRKAFSFHIVYLKHYLRQTFPTKKFLWVKVWKFMSRTNIVSLLLLTKMEGPEAIQWFWFLCGPEYLNTGQQFWCSWNSVLEGLALCHLINLDHRNTIYLRF